LIETKLKNLQERYKQLVKQGCKRDLTITERVAIRHSLTIVRKELRTIKKYINLKELFTMQNVITQNEFNQLLINWSDNVNNFKSFLIHCVGLDVNSPLFNALKANIKTEADIEKFISYHNGGLNPLDFDEALNDMLKAI